MGNGLVVKVLADHVTRDIRNAISAQQRAFRRCVYVWSFLNPHPPFHLKYIDFFYFFILHLICVCMHPFTISTEPLYVGWTNACMCKCLVLFLSPSLSLALCVCVRACMPVCNGLVGVTLGDGQPPIGMDLKRHTLFFPCEQRLDMNVRATLGARYLPPCVPPNASSKSIRP